MNTVTTALSERLALALVTLEDTAACYDGDKAADLRAAARAYARVADEVDGACSIDALRAKLATAEKQRLDLDTLRARALTDDSHRMRPAPTAPRKAGGNTGGAGSSPAVGPTRQPREEAMSTRQVTVTYSGSTGLDREELAKALRTAYHGDGSEATARPTVWHTSAWLRVADLAITRLGQPAPSEADRPAHCAGCGTTTGPFNCWTCAHGGEAGQDADARIMAVVEAAHRWHEADVSKPYIRNLTDAVRAYLAAKPAPTEAPAKAERFVVGDRLIEDDSPNVLRVLEVVEGRYRVAPDGSLNCATWWTNGAKLRKVDTAAPAQAARDDQAEPFGFIVAFPDGLISHYTDEQMKHAAGNFEAGAKVYACLRGPEVSVEVKTERKVTVTRKVRP